jgi:hypothetical protein
MKVAKLSQRDFGNLQERLGHKIEGTPEAGDKAAAFWSDSPYVEVAQAE